jgi:hypothetical protein
VAGVDSQGRPVLQVQAGEGEVEIGVSADNILNGDAPPQLVRQLLEARLQSELTRRTHGISENEVGRDWDLLQKILPGSDSQVGIRSVSRSEGLRGNHQ